MISFHTIRVALAALFVLGTPSYAQTEVSIGVFRVIEQPRIVDGKEILVEVLEPADSAGPGTKLTYRISLDNQDDVPATDISMVLPVDKNVTYLENSLSASTTLTDAVSVDGGATYGNLSDLTVAENEKTRPATVDDITNLKFEVPELAAGEKATIDYSITVD